MSDEEDFHVPSGSTKTDLFFKNFTFIVWIVFFIEIIE